MCKDDLVKKQFEHLEKYTKLLAPAQMAQMLKEPFEDVYEQDVSVQHQIERTGESHDAL